MNKTPKVSIIILNWSNLEETIKCLESMYTINYTNFDVIVIDNGSTEDPRLDLLKKFPDINYRRNLSNLGYTGGNNLGIQYSLETGADYIWLLNNDTVVPPYTLGKLIQIAEKDPEVGLISPAICSMEDPKEIVYLGSYLDVDDQLRQNARTIEEIQRWQSIEQNKVCLWGTALLIKRAVIEIIGLLDAAFFAYYEDMDYSIRAIKAGFINRLVPEVCVQHKTKAVNRKDYPDHYHFYLTRNEYLFWTKHLCEKKKLTYKRKYLANVIRKAAGYRSEGGITAADACLDGAWCALRGKYGERLIEDKMPKGFRNICTWHPFLLSRLLYSPNKK